MVNSWNYRIILQIVLVIIIDIEAYNFNGKYYSLNYPWKTGLANIFWDYNLRL